jgi:Transglycosylase SLT domain
MRRDFKIKLIATALVVATMGLLPTERAAARPPVEKPSVAEMLCSIVLTEARKQGLPESFFTRLIWRESLFDPKAVSPKGAQGIAQFMPGTARDRGLADPFLAGQALAASAHLLSDLRATFGNLGLAAAAYNAGADRVRNYCVAILIFNSVLGWMLQEHRTLALIKHLQRCTEGFTILQNINVVVAISRSVWFSSSHWHVINP